MKTGKLVLGIALIVVLSTAFGPQTSSQHKVLFEKAKFTMETKGDLKGAIKLFDEILKKYPREREYGAKAQLHIGLCSEKLGMQEAQKEYQAVIDSYPEFQQEVAIAKERLTHLDNLTRELEEVLRKPAFRKIQIPTTPGNGALSPDGKKLAFVSEGSVWVVPVHGKVHPDISGTPIRLTKAVGALRYYLAWSGDGKWIAFNAEKNGSYRMFIIPSAGGEPKEIPVDAYRGGHVYDYRLSLSPDGKVLVFASSEMGTSTNELDKNRITYIYTIPVEGGEPKKLTQNWSAEPAFSPDGKKIAYIKYHLAKNGEKFIKDLWVVPASGGTPVLVCDSAKRARGPVWSPDGRMITFNREPEEHNESREIWMVPVSKEGKPTASPTKIELPMVSVDLLAGWTTDNKIGLHLKNPEHIAIYTVPTSGGKATQVTPQGYTFHPRWSPDGKRIFFRWEGGNIASVPVGGGEVSQVPMQSNVQLFEAAPGGGNGVSPDGEKIVFSGARMKNKSWAVDIWTIPVEGGVPTQLTTSPGQDRFPCWSPDGNLIAFVRYSEPPKEKQLYMMNICVVSTETGEVRQITSESDKVSYSTIAWSPDGKSIAYFSKDKTINVIPEKSGEPRKVVEVEDVSRHHELTWSPDSKKIAYTSEGSLWVVSSDGGEPLEVKTGLDAKATHIAWSPDGKKIAFVASKGGETELWLMEDFLPLEKLAVKEKPESSTEQKGIIIRQIWTGPDVNSDGEPSPDGKYLSFTEYKTSGDLAIREIVTGTKRRLTSEADWSDLEFAHSSRWSPDGKKLAYAWSIGNGNELRITGLDGSEPRILYKNKELDCNPQDWTPDGKKILATFVRNDKNCQIGLISVADGSVRILKTVNKPHFPRASVSPDGRDIVYDFPSKEGSSERDIFLISIDGKREFPLVNHSADDRFLDWTPDGENILYKVPFIIAPG